MMSMPMYFGITLFLSFFIFNILYMIHPLLFAKGFKKVNRDLLQQNISILIPAYNEEEVVENCLKSMLALEYDNYEAIFINDGSSDNTLELLIKILDAELSTAKAQGNIIYAPVRSVYQSRKYPNVLIIDKVNGGKADSLNAGIAFALGDIVITLDADSVLKSDSLLYVNEAFQDENVIAAGGMIHVGQMFDDKGNIQFKGKGLLKYQLSDYLNSFYLRKTSQASLNVLSVVSGAFGAFRRQMLFDINGYKKTLGEDMEITLNIQKCIKSIYPNSKLVFMPNAVCYTEVPENFRDSFKQKNRWQKGFIDCVLKYKFNFFRKFSAKFSIFLLWDSLMHGLVGVTSVILLPIIIILHRYDEVLIMLYILSILSQISTRLMSYVIAYRYGYKFSGKQYLVIFFFSIYETYTYRLLDPLIFGYGIASYFISKDKHNWNKMKRLGTVSVKNETAA